MTKTLTAFLISLTLLSCNDSAHKPENAASFTQEFHAEDVIHFWNAYDQINQTTDTLKQAKLLKALYLDIGSEGLHDLVEARRYSENEFLTAITSYPKFWKSIRENTLQTSTYQTEISKDIEKLKQAYPNLTPSKIYFTMGAFRTNGTVNENNVLIGSELALADEHTAVHELPEWRQPFYKEYAPLKNLSLLCTHEYIHTQQQPLVENLLSMCLYEGVAEFISCHVTGKPSSSPAINFGKEHEKKVVEKFVEDLYLMSNNYNWLWGENRNELEVRDLGYYIGYEISERYYTKSEDKQKAIKELIELDYMNEEAVEHIVDASGLLPRPISTLYEEYEAKRPTVTRIKEFKNGSLSVDPATSVLTVEFSEALNGRDTGLDYGEKGQEFYPKVDNSTRTWGDDNTSYSFQISLEPNTAYQMVVGSNFRLTSGIRLKPYVIEFQTGE